MRTATKQPDKAVDPKLQTFRIQLEPSHWIPLTGITMVGCVDAADARKKLHDELDRHILAIEKGR